MAMDESSIRVAPSADSRPRVVDWGLLGRRLRRPALWIAALSVLAAASTSAAAYLWATDEDATPPAVGRFRFDDVFVLERGASGNNTTVAVVPWFSNPGDDALGAVDLVLYILDEGRNLAEATQRHAAGELSGRLTANATLEFQLNHTKNYRIEILVLVDGFLAAEGYGSITFDGAPLRLRGADGGVRVAFLASDFEYEYYDG